MTNQEKNRETWLNNAAMLYQPAFADAGAPLPANVRIAIGFPSTGKKGSRIGECWDYTASADGTFEILLRPDLSDPVELLATLVHELVHAAVGIEAGHGKQFKQLATALRLEGKMKSTHAGEAFKQHAAPILEALGPLPHAALNFAGLTTRPKKQTTRLVKCECRECGYLIRTTRKWIADIGVPHCPLHGAMTCDGEAPEDAPDEGFETIEERPLHAPKPDAPMLEAMDDSEDDEFIPAFLRAAKF